MTFDEWIDEQGEWWKADTPDVLEKYWDILANNSGWHP